MTLFKHQIEGINFLKGNNPGGGQSFILGDEMGLGKTRQAIVASEESQSRGTLIVCPASLKINWQREIMKVFDGASIEIIDSKSEISSENYWHIINYDILEKRIGDIELLVEEKKLDTLILDEAHYIKGKSLRAKVIIGGRMKKKGGMVSFKGLAKSMNRVYALTGTPILNRPIEIFNILKAIGHPLGKNEMEFAKRYCELFWMCKVKSHITGKTFVTTQEKAYQFYNGKKDYSIVGRFPNYQGANNLNELRKNLEGWILRRKKKDVLDLPEKITDTVISEMDDDWKKKYETAWDSYIDFVRNNPMPERDLDNILMARHLVEITKLKQVCSWSKIGRIADDVETAVGDIQTETLTGANDQEERQVAVDNFQNDPKTKVFVANIKAGGVGINLTEASIVMFADMDWSPEIHRQAEDRAHRIGQGGTVNIYYYICPGTIEEDIIDVLNKKKGIADQILEGTKKRVNSKGGQEEFLRRISERVDLT